MAAHAKVRYTAVGRDGARAVLTLTSDEQLIEEWAGLDAEPTFSGAARLVGNAALCARLHQYVAAKKAQRVAAQGLDAVGQGEEAAAEEVMEALTGIEDDSARETFTEEELEEAPSWFENLWHEVKTEKVELDVVLAWLSAETEAAENSLLQVAEILGYGEWVSDERDREAWCSACLQRTVHKFLAIPGPWYDAWCCRGCGVITTRCAVPACANMSVRGMGPTGTRAMAVPMCAEHTHEIPDFEASGYRIEDLEHWKDLFEYKRKDVGRIAKRGAVAAGVTVVAVPLAVVAAPAIGGAVGVATSAVGSGATLSGAAAVNHGLALLGGGTIASGGLGMAGGTLVIAAAGGAVGGAYGMRVGTAYLGEDASFTIECVRDGDGPAVVYSSGFLTESDDAWSRWKRLIDTAYPENPVYRVSWGAKERKDLAALAGKGAAGHRGVGAVAMAALRATRLAVAKIAPFAVLSTAVEVAANPWTVAQRNASAAGTTLASILRRTENKEGFILVGHSLGAALMTAAIVGLAEDDETSPVVDAHLLGAATSTEIDGELLAAGVTGKVRNYFSRRDKVLAALYRMASLGGEAAGAVGFKRASGRVVNIDVSAEVPKHSDYVMNLGLRTE
ncbi:hypothetical protein AXF14_09150 [Actinomyces radicidentis]|uniref:DUF726 domain-containing protein n=1 Tax=Actinomyces radicidentis TaxID=111015 RepID=A0A0X8JFL0_ACTRD|nr:DUF726 domain-containing protein [Actinomyces radicidentis]AMD87719.1 hypothetical protein AXF14_09150 [Actinomyces radicidentis]